jgi:hypothetical protein
MGLSDREWSHFQTLLGWAVGGLAHLWPVTLVIAAGIAVGVWCAWKQRPRRALLSVAWQVLLLAIPLAILALGAKYACENCSPSSLGQGVRHQTAMRVVDGLLVLQLACSGWLVYAARRRRILVAAVQILVLWCTFWASLMAGMSMSGDWL